MYTVKKTFEISAAHSLNTDYGILPCNRLHGHNWVITVTLEGIPDDKGMLMDFTHIKDRIHELMDHRNLNEVMSCNPTSEVIATFIADEIGSMCVEVEVAETPTNVAIYTNRFKALYRVKKTFEICAAHALETISGCKILPCSRLHGHNWVITITLESERLDVNGMIMDFDRIKNRIHGIMDHRNLNMVLPCNPTAENIAKYIADEIGYKCIEVEVAETPTDVAIYTR